MKWIVEYTDEFGEWWETLNKKQQDDITVPVELLEEKGPRLQFPHSSGIRGSRYGHLRELRVQSGGNPLRIFCNYSPPVEHLKVIQVS